MAAAPRTITLPRRRFAAPPCAAEGELIYAIGDVHGRLDLFSALIDAIEADARTLSKELHLRIIALGDVIDRGPDSRALLTAIRKSEASVPGFEMLLGNHEAALLDSIAGDAEAQAMWIEFGGDRTLASYGIEPPDDEESPAAFARRLADAVGPETIDWLEARPLCVRSGDFFFVHAGVRPGVPLDRQGRDDMLWIRKPFLDSRRHHGAVVVHGHTIEPEPTIRANRIGIDTGAYRTGRLTALRIAGSDACLLQTSGPGLD